MNKFSKVFVIMWLLLFAFFVISGISSALTRNLLALDIIKSIFSHSLAVEPLTTVLKERSPQDCDAIWFSIQLTPHQNHQNDYQALLVCSEDYIGLVAINRPLDLELALQAYKQRPLDANIWSWLANAQIAAHSWDAVTTLQKMLSLDPRNSLTWCALAGVYERDQQIEPARDAYLQCCKTGDRSGGGCYGAGRMEESLGFPQKAIEAYRLSFLSEALKRVEALEKMLKP